MLAITLVLKSKNSDHDTISKRLSVNNNIMFPLHWRILKHRNTKWALFCHHFLHPCRGRGGGCLSTYPLATCIHQHLFAHTDFIKILIGEETTRPSPSFILTGTFWRVSDQQNPLYASQLDCTTQPFSKTRACLYTVYWWGWSRGRGGGEIL